MSSRDFTNFMLSLAADIASEYQRIQTRVREDPGTAGDQVEENWAELLRRWLPATYPVVTKGRIVNEDGVASPQVDLLVLDPAYPIFLRDKKLYFAAGVVAAFECKLTLKPHHLAKVFQTCRIIKGLQERRVGNPYVELHQPITYGVLAHSHGWSRSEGNCFDRIIRSIHHHHTKWAEHPHELPDAICIADTATFVCVKELNFGPDFDAEAAERFDGSGWDGGVSTYYFGYETEEEGWRGFQMSALGSLICEMTVRLAWENPTLRPYAEYLDRSTPRSGLGLAAAWSPDAVSAGVAAKLRARGTSKARWSNWRQHFS